ncbi:MAG: carboxypeptidase-like regulatory domain-containing protein [Candidatus Sulfotelmatobacter sp.]
MAVPAATKNSGKLSSYSSLRGLMLGAGASVYLSFGVLVFGSTIPALEQSQQSSTMQRAEPGAPGTHSTGAPSPGQQPDRQSPGIISGIVTDKAGDLAVGAKVQLTGEAQTPSQELMSGDNGEFSFTNVPPGPFHLTITARGFDTQQFSGELNPGQAYLVPAIKLALAAAVTEVKVRGSAEEVAEAEVKQELQQRVFGFIPNFYVAYSPDPPPLFPKQKFELAWRSVIDPVTLLGVGFLAGVEQASDRFGGYGQGAAGYGRRFGAAYGDVIAGTFIGSAILPSLLHQDPRYFYLGTGSTKSRLMHALVSSVVARNDNTKQWEPNYSGIIGSFAAGAVTYAYYPASDRGAGLFVENSLIGIGATSVADIIQEFVLRRFTSHVPPQTNPPHHP